MAVARTEATAMAGNDTVFDAVRCRDNARLQSVLAALGESAKQLVNQPQVVQQARKHGYGDDEYWFTPLQLAVVRDNADAVRLLLGAGADPNQAAAREHLPLLLACRADRNESFSYDCIKALLEGGADPNVRLETTNVFPLHEAVKQQRNDLVELLLEHGASPLSWDKNGVSPLGHVTNDEQRGIALMLVRRGADPFMREGLGGTPFNDAARSSRATGCLEFYLKKLIADRCTGNSDGNGYAIVCIQDALYKAMARECGEHVDKLLAAGREINNGQGIARSKHLLYAVEAGDPVLAARLMEEGADPMDGLDGGKNKENNAVLRAIEKGRQPVLKTLLCSGMVDADVVGNVLVGCYMGGGWKDKRGRYRPYTHEETVADWNDPWRKAYRETRIMAEPVRREIMKAVLLAGWDAARTDKLGNTLLHHLCEHGAGSQDMGLALEQGLDPNQRNQAGMTPLLLYLSCESPPPSVAVVERLLMAGADVGVRTPDGRGALDVVQGNEAATVKVIEYLRDAGAPEQAGRPVTDEEMKTMADEVMDERSGVLRELAQ